MSEEIFYCEGEETEFLKYGDIFTVDPKSPGVQFPSMVMDGDNLKKFRLIPRKISAETKIINTA